MDWPGSEEIADRMDAMLPPQVLQKGLEEQLGNIPPKVKALLGSMQNQMRQMDEQLKMAAKEIESNRAELGVKKRIGDQNYDAKITDIAAKLQMHVEDLIAQRLGAKEQIEKEGFESGRDQHNRNTDREEQRQQREVETRLREREMQQSASTAGAAS